MQAILLSCIFICAAATANPKITPGADLPVTRSGYPKTFERWGEAGVARINKAIKNGAQTVAANSKCDKVEIVALSDGRSSPPNNIVLFADCRNGERFYLTEAQANQRAATASQSQKLAGISKGDAIVKCRDAIRANLAVPSSFNPATLSTQAISNKTTGTWLVTMKFKSKNRMGQELPGNAECSVSGDGPPQVTIN
ncbi:MAG: hypothetical protein CMK02_07970 [Polycyclovorans sp.]|nr:hypothetical protein [Rhodospirillaceae bacterium]MAY26218.1 hypothetical protein [Polycyclovorans sp.]QDP49923.1 MAG: hypothetical protein GOVbin132_67 [Prokaryotic dsDNA virus sp.]MAX61581.1 hypothetical protein [Rhodospirillaceae bacterium]MAX61646.1 hypothetical protein [Rhodospirillaceae bacterium]